MEKYTELATALVEYYAITDKKCKDPARFFYGAKDCETKWLGNHLPLTVAADVLIKPHRERVKQQQKLEEQRAKMRVVVASSEVSKETLDEFSRKLISNVKNAPDGHKHEILRNNSATFGGYIASGYYDYDEVKQWLKNAIRQNGNNVQSITHADATIEEGLNYGMYRPLYFEDTRNRGVVAKQQIRLKPSVPELDGVHPPLSTSQKAQVVDIISKREYELYHRVLKDLGIETGYPDMVNEHLMLGYREKSVDADGVIIPEAITVPYYVNTDVVGLEFISDDAVTYDGSVGLYDVKPMFNEESSYGIILPNSLQAIDFYLSGDGSASVHGLPQSKIELDLPDKDLYCIITNDYDLEQLQELSKLGVKFVKVRNLKAMINALSREEIETVATRGMKLEAVI